MTIISQLREIVKPKDSGPQNHKSQSKSKPWRACALAKKNRWKTNRLNGAL